MAPNAVISAQQADFTFQVGELDPGIFRVLGFEGSEGISELFRFRVELCADDLSIDVSALVGQSACLQIIADSERRRFVHGIVRRMERVGHGSRLGYYAAEIVPASWLLTKRYQSRIFQEARCPDMTMPGILAAVLHDAGLPEEFFSPFILDASYEARELVSQYRETDHDFVSRLMEHAGIFYFFEHGPKGHRLVVSDAPRAHKPLPVCDEFVYRDPNGLVPETEFVFEVRECRQIEHGAVQLDDFNFRQSEQAMWMRGESRLNGSTALLFSDYPGEFDSKDAGGRFAQVRMELFAWQRNVLSMAATVRTLAPGFRFALSEHPTQSLNREYLVTHVTHTARQPQSLAAEADGARGLRNEARVQAIPADVPFRAPRRTPRPVVIGTQTAVVVGPDSEEIHTDADGYGRVKVQFHWDRGGEYPKNGSCWVRVSQGWAGGGYGMLFLPRIGQEVIVEFLDGNPDRPIVTGRVYNHDHMPPYAKDAKTRSTIKSSSSKGGEGSNEITFEDLKDQERLVFHAQRDLHLRVRNDRIENVLNDQHLTVDKNLYEKVGADRHMDVVGNQVERIAADVSTAIRGKESKQVDGTMSLTVQGDAVYDLKSNLKCETGQTILLKGMNIRIEAGMQLELVVGGNMVQICPAGIFIAGRPLINLNSGTTAPVMPVTALATAPEAPAAPLEAEDVQFGADHRYVGEERELDPLAIGSLAPGEPESVEPKVLSWIEIVLVDELDQPIPGERYELKLPDGKLRKGSLDANGHARVEGIEPGTCQICFPNLDMEAWERI